MSEQQEPQWEQDASAANRDDLESAAGGFVFSDGGVVERLEVVSSETGLDEVSGGSDVSEAQLQDFVESGQLLEGLGY